MGKGLKDGRCLAYGIDTLVLNVYGSLKEGKELYLKGLKKEAKRSPEEAVVDICSTGFRMLPHGKSGFGYILESSKMRLYLSSGQSLEYPRIQLYFYSAFLWEEGAEKAIEKGLDIARFFLKRLVKIQPSRLDLACDLGDTSFSLSDLEVIVTRATTRSFYLPAQEKEGDSKEEVVGFMQGRRFTGFRLGRGKLLARIYDKALELQKNPVKKEIMEQVYSRPIEKEERIWRVEFQMRREVLRELEIESLSDMRKKLFKVWSYLTQNWLLLKEKGRSSQPTRWRTDNRWKLIQSAFSLNPLRGKKSVLKRKSRKRRPKARIKALGRQIVGCLTTVGACCELSLVDLNSWLSQLLGESLDNVLYEKHLLRKIGRTPINLESIKKISRDAPYRLSVPVTQGRQNADGINPW